MNRTSLRSILVTTTLTINTALLTTLSGCANSQPKAMNKGDAPRTGATAATADAPKPRLYRNFGTYHRVVTTNSRECQKWFDQGMQLLYGFNHDEAIRSFTEAARIDPGCAMAWWGVSYAHGLHINNPVMTQEQSRGGFTAATRALAALDTETPAEQALVRAVVKRYQWPPPEDRMPLDEAYAEAMKQAWEAHPSDADIGALFAESLMNMQPWKLWTPDGQPLGRTPEIVAAIERVLEIDENHPGANHFYIHAVEASLHPEKALPSADRLGDLVPGSGHLVHMPAHIYIRTGQYDRSADTNERAIKVDKTYFKTAPPPRFYNLYYVHNVHFVAYSAMFEGRYEKAMEAARQMDREVAEIAPLNAFLRAFAPQAEGLTPVTYHVMVRFGKWEDILKEPEPDDYRMISRAMRLYARSVAQAALGRTDEARQELDAFDELAKTIGDEWFVGQNTARSVLPIARKMMEGEILYREGKRDEAFALMREAVTMEENLAYDEPPGWMQPVRHALGALLLHDGGDGSAKEAEEVYRADLERHPNNGWSLLGLREALEAQGRDDEAKQVAAQLKKAWARADVEPESSCYCAAAQ
jgi:tetratricopeptide (TPR) repeat protein